MTDTNLTVTILREIRDELREVRTQSSDTNTRLDVTNARLEAIETNTSVTNARLGVIEHTLVDFGTQVVFAGRLIRSIERRYDVELADVRTRLTRLESDE